MRKNIDVGCERINMDVKNEREKQERKLKKESFFF